LAFFANFEAQGAQDGSQKCENAIINKTFKLNFATTHGFVFIKLSFSKCTSATYCNPPTLPAQRQDEGIIKYM
jgi:hypothetical protein